MHKIEQLLADAEISVEFRDEHEEALVRMAAQGKDVEEWLRSPAGRFVIGAAAQDTRDIESELTTIKPNTPWRRRKIVELQQRHEAIGMAVQWLRDAVVIGASAERELIEEASQG